MCTWIFGKSPFSGEIGAGYTLTWQVIVTSDYERSGVRRKVCNVLPRVLATFYVKVALVPHVFQLKQLGRSKDDSLPSQQDRFLKNHEHRLV